MIHIEYVTCFYGFIYLYFLSPTVYNLVPVKIKNAKLNRLLKPRQRLID